MENPQKEIKAVKDTKEGISVPYIVHEGTIARFERTIKRLIIGLIISVCLMFASNIAWILYINSFDMVSYEYTQDGAGVNLVGDGVGVNYGTTVESNGTQEKEEVEN